MRTKSSNWKRSSRGKFSFEENPKIGEEAIAKVVIKRLRRIWCRRRELNPDASGLKPIPPERDAPADDVFGEICLMFCAEGGS